LLNNRQPGRRRGRGRGPQGNNGPRGNESRIDSRARGNAPQMLEKFKNLARDAQQQGDRVMTEYYLQFSDHYFRIVAESRARFEESRPRREDGQADDGYDGDTGSEDFAADDRVDSNDGDTRAEPESRPRRDSAPRDSAPRDNTQRDSAPRESRPRENGRENGRVSNRDRPERADRQPRSRAGNGNVARDQEDHDEPSPSISIDILPPALGVTADPIQDIDAVEPAPRRRARPRRPAAEVAEAEG
jgi:Domain of unknown function (DUF4167)